MTDIAELVERLREAPLPDWKTLVDLCHEAAAALLAIARERDKAKDDLKYYGGLHTEEYNRIRAELAAANEQNRKLREALGHADTNDDGEDGE